MKRSFLLALMALGLNTAAYAQTHDYQLFLSPSVSKDITKKLSTELSFRFDLRDNVGALSRGFTQLGVAYDINKKISVGTAYRFVYLFDDNTNRHVVFANLNLKHEASDVITLNLRNRYQGIIFSDDTPMRHFVRLFPSVNIKLSKKFKLELGPEGWLNATDNLMDRWRGISQLSWKFAKKQQLSLEVFYESQLNRKSNDSRLVFELGYNYKL